MPSILTGASVGVLTAVSLLMATDLSTPGCLVIGAVMAALCGALVVVR